MSTLVAPPFGLALGDPIVAVARAANAIGWSPLFSPPNAGLAVTVQQAPASPPTAPLRESAGAQSLAVSMPLVAADQTGGSAITSYNLQYDQGGPLGSGTAGSAVDDDFVSLIGEVPDTNTAQTALSLSGLVPNTVYTFRYRVKSKHGWSGFSPLLGILTATEPAAMTHPTVSYSASSPTSVTVAWTAPYSGGSPITAYSVLLQHGDDPADFSEEPTYCDGASLALMTAGHCDIPLVTLRAPPFDLTLGQMIYAKVAATNTVGQGAYSDVNTASVSVQTEPSPPPNSPALVAYDETSATVSLEHLSGLAAGDSPVLYYAVAWDRGLEQTEWSVYTVVSSSTSLVTVRGLTSGATYAFKYRAQNVHGWSLGYSPVLTATAMRVPGQAGPVATSMDGATVLLEWEEPFTGGQGIELTSYTIELLDADGGLAEYPHLCDGSAPTVRSAGRCGIPMSAFTAATSYDGAGLNSGGLGLALGDLIVARVAASNAAGTGAYSALNSAGVSAQTPPVAPPSAPYGGAATTESLLDVHWAFLAGAGQDGGSPLLSYGLDVDDGAGGPFAPAVGASPLTAPYTLNSAQLTTAIASGLTYRLRYRAYNVHGWGPDSPIGTIVAATLPDAPPEPALSLVGAGVQVTWSPPDDTGGAGIAVTAYRVEVRLPDGAYKEDLVDCDGSDPAIVAAGSCTIPMSTLTSADPATGFAFSQGDEITARVAAATVIGYGAPGPVASAQTVLAEVPPRKPPTAPRRGAGTGEAQLVIDWDALVAPDNGGSAATSYNLQWDQGTGTYGPHLTGVAADYLSTSHTQTAALLAGGVYRFRYRAANKYGWGPFSDEVTIQAAETPAAPAAAATSIADHYVRFAWAEPDDGSAPIEEYEILLRQADGATYAEETTFCEGSRPAIVGSRYCLVPMSTLRAAPYSLQYSDLVVAVLRARNAIGWSPWSTANAVGALVQTEPFAASTPAPTRGVRTDHTRVEVEWTAMTLAGATGGSPVTSYNLEWNSGDGSDEFASLAGAPGSPYLATTYLLASGLVSAGTTYRFRLRAWNKWGVGGPSATLDVEASSIPGAVGTVTTAISGSNARISWTAPEAHGSAIVAYTVALEAADGSYAEETGHCDGASAAVVASRACEIPLTTLREAPFGLAFDALVAAVVSAHNGNGEGPASAPNVAGARIQTEPVQMAAPARLALTSETQLHIGWAALTAPAETGGAVVSSYGLEWDAGSGEAAWYELAGLTASFLGTEFVATTGVDPGGSYAVRVSAYNAHGWGAASPAALIVASAAPDLMLAPTSAIAGEVYVRVAWAAADANSDPLDAYEVLIATSAGTFETELTACDGASAGPVSDNYCDIPLLTLRAPPFSLQQGEPVLAQVRAHNSIGWGPLSAATNPEEGDAAALVEVEPHQMAAVARGTSTSTSQVHVEWLALAGLATGGAAVDSYHLEWDAASGGAAWESLQGGPEPGDYSLLTSHTVSGPAITPGTSYQFRVSAHNAHGWGAASAAATVVAAATPDAPDAPVTSIENIYVKIAWAEPASNSADIDGYDVYVARQDGSYARESTYCDGYASPTVLAEAYCLVPMAVLRGATYSLARGDIVRAQVRAHNEYGAGELSPANAAGVAVQTAPEQVVSLVAGPATTESQVELVWEALVTAAETGGSPILSYNAQWDQGNAGPFENLVGYLSDFAATGFTVTSGISPGAEYRFRVRAKNMWGWGEYSSVLTAAPSAAPEQMGPVVTALEPTTGAVALSWTPPADNAAPITAYSIEVLDHDGLAWSEEGTHCDGSTAAVRAASRCTIPMATLSAAPFSLERGDLVQARARAYNSNGWSVESATNTDGARVRTPPTFMHPPVRDPTSSDSQIVLTWSTLTAEEDTGGAAILSYGLEWDAGTAGASWSALAGFTVRSLTPTFTVSTGLTPGHGYQFRLSAENLYGWGPTSTATTAYAAGLPAQPFQAVTTNAGTVVTISFSEPENSAAPIEAYKIWVRHADGSFSEEATHCDGADAAIVAALSCDVPLTALRASYGLAYDELVQARVQAKNANGWGSLSQVNLVGARVQTEPTRMAAPVMGSATSTAELEVVFTALTTAVERGGAAIDSYHLEWDQGTGAWADLMGQEGAY